MGLEIDSAPILEALLRLLKKDLRQACQVRLTCAAAGDYAAGDVLAAVVTDTLGVSTYLPNLAREKGGTSTIKAVLAKASNVSLLNQVRVHLFNREPVAAEVEMDDNAAFSVKTAEGLLKHQGSFLLGAFVSRVGAEAESFTTTLSVPLTCSPTETGLWAVFVTEGAETNEAANMTIDFTIWVE